VVEVRELVRERTGRRPNVDFALAALAEAGGLAADAGEAVFAIARSAGWLAHALDEYAEPAVAFRYRPVARYVGPAGPAKPQEPLKSGI
jgi:citrate synthase